jgi:hypothetical protein
MPPLESVHTSGGSGSPRAPETATAGREAGAAVSSWVIRSVSQAPREASPRTSSRRARRSSPRRAETTPATRLLSVRGCIRQPERIQIPYTRAAVYTGIGYQTRTSKAWAGCARPRIRPICIPPQGISAGQRRIQIWTPACRPVGTGHFSCNTTPGPVPETVSGPVSDSVGCDALPGLRSSRARHFRKMMEVRARPAGNSCFPCYLALSCSCRGPVLAEVVWLIALMALVTMR